MFDLPGGEATTEITESQDRHVPKYAESDGTCLGQVEAIEHSVRELLSDGSTVAVPSKLGLGESAQLEVDSPVMVSEVSADDSMVDETTNPEDPWVRRLRELSQVAAASSPSPASAPVPKVDSPTAIEDDNTASVEDDEYSVEAQLARLLGRPRAAVVVPVDNVPPIKQKISPPSELNSSKQSNPDETALPADDRSHLSEGPRHKQNKNAVREEVQSFRAVAQMSARSALAKYSWTTLRTDFIFTAGLTSVAGLTTAWFFGSLALGREIHYWKGITCAIAMIAAAQRLFRSYLQLQKWRHTNDVSSNKAKPVAKLRLPAADEKVSRT